MKTTQLIALVCSFVSCATLRAVATGADFLSDAVAQGAKIEFNTEMGNHLVAESVQDAGAQKGGANKGETLVAFSLLASAVSLVVLLNAILRAPEGYEDGDGFHFSMQREQTPVRHIRRTLAPI
jgi:hypothetical protein